MAVYLTILLLQILSFLPLGLARAIGSLLGGLGWLISSRMAVITRQNIKLCFPELSENEQKSLAKQSIRETFRAIIEIGAIWFWPVEKILGRIWACHGLEILQRARAEGKGVILIGPHLGTWELLGHYMSTSSLGQIILLYQALKDPKLDKLIMKARSRSGAILVATDSKGVGQLLAALKKGQIVGILPDQVPVDSGGEFSPFFGNSAFTMTLLSRLLAKTGARAVLGYAKRVSTEKGHGFEIVFREADERIYDSDIKISLDGLNKSIEDAVRALPEQYQWEYKRFKRQPPGKQQPY